MTAAEFDRLLQIEGWGAVQGRLDPATSDGRARLALAAVMSQEPDRVETALISLEGLSGPLALGARLFCLGALGRYDEVQQGVSAFSPADNEASSLEGTVYAMVAGAVADTEQGRPADHAASRLHVAQVLAGLLGMRYRAQWAQIEGQRLRLPTGTACPRALEDAAALVPMSPSRQAWHREVSAAALLSHGRYMEAAMIAPRDTGVGMFAAVLRREAAAGESDGGFGSLALALEAIRRGKDASALLDTVTAHPERGYADVLRMASALKTGAPLPCIQPPLAPDQRLLWGLLRWEAAWSQACSPEVGIILAALEQARAALGCPTEALAAAQEFAPVAVAAYLASPLGSGAEMDVPLLVGEHLRWQGELHKLPGKRGGGQALVLSALGLPREMSRVERLRLRRALQALGVEREPVNVAEVLRALALLAGGRRQEGWDEALRAVTDSVTGRAAIREIRALYPPRPAVYAEHA